MRPIAHGQIQHLSLEYKPNKKSLGKLNKAIRLSSRGDETIYNAHIMLREALNKNKVLNFWHWPDLSLVTLQPPP